MESIKNYSEIPIGATVRHANKSAVPKFIGKVVRIWEPERVPPKYEVLWGAAHGYPERTMFHYGFELMELHDER